METSVSWHTRSRMPDVDALSRSLIAGATRLADRGAMLALSVALITGIVAVSAYLTGLAALSGSGRTVWLVLGGALVVLIVGAPLVARHRLRGVRRDAVALFEEVRSLLTGNREAQRVVIDIQEAESSPPPAASGSPGTAVNPAMMAQSQRYGEFRRIALTSNNLRQLPLAMTAITTFPALLAIALAGILLFGLLGFVFLLIWLF